MCYVCYFLSNSIAFTSKNSYISTKTSRDTEKKKKKKNKKNQHDGKAVTKVEQNKKNESHEVEENEATKSSQLRTYGNGLVIEDLAMSKPDGKRTFPGS